MEQRLHSLGLNSEKIDKISTLLNTIQDKAQCFNQICKNILSKADGFEVYLTIFSSLFPDLRGFAYLPDEETIATANITKIMRELNISTYPEFFNWAKENRYEFWDKSIKALNIKFATPYSSICDNDDVTKPNWLPNAKYNIVDSCFNANPTKNAIVTQDEGGKITHWSYQQLSEKINRIANGLVNQGFKPGDTIAIDMVMTADSVAIYLGIIKAGCVVISIADSFAPPEIATRLRIAKAKAIFAQDYIYRAGKKLPLYQKVCEANAPRIIVVPGDEKTDLNLREQDIYYDEFLDNNTAFDSVINNAKTIINILFSSGTTGDPKAIPWTQTTPIKAAADGFYHQNIQTNDVIAWPTNLGWMMGPWLIFASLINQATIALFTGAPMGQEFGRFIQDANVTKLGVIPSIVKTWRNSRCIEDVDWSNIKCFTSTGECSNSEDMLYLMYLGNMKPIIEYCGGTEIGGAYLSSTVIEGNIPSAFSTPTLGLDILLLNEDKSKSELGEVAIIPPSIGLSNELLNRDHQEVYFQDMPKGPHGEVLRRHGDELKRLDNGYYIAEGRADDTMNLGGVKTSSAEIERALNQIPAINETAAIAISPPGGGPKQLIIYCVLLEEIEKNILLKQCQDIIKTQLNPLFKVHDLVFIDKLPRTASNKVMRRVLRDQYIAQ